MDALLSSNNQSILRFIFSVQYGRWLRVMIAIEVDPSPASQPYPYDYLLIILCSAIAGSLPALTCFVEGC